MSTAALHYTQFREEVVRTGYVHTFTHDSDYLVFRIGDHEVVPFWSSTSRLKRVSAAHPKYTQYEIESIPLTQFLELISRFEREGIRIGTNWAGKRLTGYDVDVPSLRSALGYWIKRLGLPQ